MTDPHDFPDAPSDYPWPREERCGMGCLALAALAGFLIAGGATFPIAYGRALWIHPDRRPWRR